MISDLLEAFYRWLIANWQSLAFSIIGVVVVYVAYNLLNKEITKLKERSLTRMLHLI
jgi:uncharacterized membrane protein